MLSQIEQDVVAVLKNALNPQEGKAPQLTSNWEL